MKLRKKYRNILICIIIIFSIIASVTIANASNFNTLRNRVEQAITKIEQVKSSNSILNKILNEMSDGIAEDESDQEANQGSDQEKSGESDDKSGQTSGNIDEEQEENTETQNDNKYNVQMELNIITEEGEAVTEGNKLKITDITDTYEENNSQEETGSGEDEETGDNDNPEKSEEITQKSELEIKILNLTSGDEILEDEEGSFQTGEQGVIVDFSNMEKNKKYQVLIENLEVTEDYIKTIDSMTLELQVDEEENIIAKIINIKNSEEQDIGVEGQFWANLHDANGNGEVKIPQQSIDSNIQIQYKIDQNGQWQNYSGEANISQNGTIYAKASKNGRESNETQKIIRNIDKEEPELENYEEISTTEERMASVKLVMTDNASGIAEYGISRTETKEPDYIRADKDLTDEDIENHRNASPEKRVEATIDGIYENGTYYLWIVDSAGNCAKKEIEIKNLKEVPVAEITEASEAHHNLVGQQYTSLYSAIQACPTDDNGEKTTITLLTDIIDENNEINNRDIVLNLCGYTVDNKSTKNPTITVNESCSFTLINTEKDNHNINKSAGALKSQNTEAILVNENATLTVRNRGHKSFCTSTIC